MQFWPSFLLYIFMHQRIGIIQAALFTFLLENPEVFQDCENEEGYLGVADMLDLSNLQIELFDDSVHVEGSCTIRWNADPHDRVELRSDIYKYERGTWQPTVFTLIHKDFCRTLFDESDIWYKTWSRFVEPNDRKCITNKGHTYHHIPFDLETVFDVQGEDISGRHKIVIHVDAYNIKIEKQPYSVCLEVVGDIIKNK